MYEALYGDNFNEIEEETVEAVEEIDTPKDISQTFIIVGITVSFLVQYAIWKYLGN